MRKAKVLHNPGAGEGETTKRELVKQIESEGFKCSYSSTKKGGVGKNWIKGHRFHHSRRRRWNSKACVSDVAEP